MSIGGDYTDDSQGHGTSESSSTVDVAQHSRIRWFILMLSCFLLFGNYFAYDNPAALNTQLQKHLEMPYDDYQYLLSALYSVYSLPNTVLPFVFGHLVDRFAFALIGLMVKAEQQKYGSLDQTPTPSRSSSVTDTLQADSSTATSDDEAESCRAPLLNSPMSPRPSSHSVVFTPGRPKLGKEPSLHVITDQTLLEVPPTATVATWQEVWWDGVLSFPTTFWLICLLTVLLYGTVVPFNNIASDFLQSKWYPGNARKATAVMGIPDTIGSVLVPIFGLLVDRHGGRATILIVSAAVMVAVHSTLGFTMLNPIFAFVLLGVAYSMYGVALWPSIACVIKNEFHLGMGYGISASFLNISLTFVPPIVATIRVVGGSFVPVEMFFIAMGLAGIVAGIVLKSMDARQGGALEAPEIEVDVPVIVPPPGTSTPMLASPDGLMVSPLLSPRLKCSSMNPAGGFSEHLPSPLGIYQHCGDDDDNGEGISLNSNSCIERNSAGSATAGEGAVPLVEPVPAPNQSRRSSQSRNRRVFTLPWTTNRTSKPLPASLGPRWTGSQRTRPSIPRSLTSDSDNNSLVQLQGLQGENASSASVASSTRPRFYGSFSTPSIASFSQGSGFFVDDEATLNEPTARLRPLPPRHQYSVRQHPILHNPLRGSSGSFRIHRNARRIRFGEGEEGNLFWNGQPVAHMDDLQNGLMLEQGANTPTSVVVHSSSGGGGGVGGDESAAAPEEDDPDGRNEHT
ncbi:hypothetical protein BGZ73_003044 [Actinomortierella ambigua]|nr:hypothetical protein BGZ73_003044 [Actinomortierella ambigua]